MANSREGSPDGGYSLPHSVDWLSFIIDQRRATANIFLAEMEGIKTEFVAKNLTKLGGEDYESSMISQRILQEMQDYEEKLIRNLRKQRDQTEVELKILFPLLQSGNQMSQNGELVSTDPEFSTSKDAVYQGGGICDVDGSSGRIFLNIAPNSPNGSNISNILEEKNENTVDSNGMADVSVENHESSVDARSETDSEDKLSKTNGISNEFSSESIELETKAEPMIVSNATSVNDRYATSASEPASVYKDESASDDDLEPINSLKPSNTNEISEQSRSVSLELVTEAEPIISSNVASINVPDSASEPEFVCRAEPPSDDDLEPINYLKPSNTNAISKEFTAKSIELETAAEPMIVSNATSVNDVYSESEPEFVCQAVPASDADLEPTYSLKSSNTNGISKESSLESIELQTEAEPMILSNVACVNVPDSASEPEFVCKAEPANDGDLEPINSFEQPANCSSNESYGSPEWEYPGDNMYLGYCFESSLNPTEMKSEDNESIYGKYNAELSLGVNRDISSVPRATPPGTIFLEKSNIQHKKYLDVESWARKLTLFHASEYSDDDCMQETPCPVETVSKNPVDWLDAHVPFEQPKSLYLARNTSEFKAEERDSSGDEKPSEEGVRINEGDSDGADVYSYENDYKLKPGVCCVSLEPLAKVILDELRTNKTIDLSLYMERSQTDRIQRSEPEDEIVKALRRLASFNPCLKEGDKAKPSQSKSAKSKKTKEKSGAGDCEDYYYDATSEDFSETESELAKSEPALRRIIPAPEGLLKDELVGSDDEDLDGVQSSSSEEFARKSVLKEASKVKLEVYSGDELKTTVKKLPGKRYFTPGVCRIPKENTSDSDDFVPAANLRRSKKKIVILSDSDEDASRKNEGSDGCLEVALDGSNVGTKKLRRKGHRYSIDSDSDYKTKKKTRKRVKYLSDSDLEKNKRRKTINVEVDIASGNESDDEELSNANANKGRKNIRKIMSKKELLRETRLAEQEEEKRKKRIADRQAQFNELFEAPETAVVKNLILDFDQKKKKALVSVDPTLVKKLKPHQVEGVKFMWNACFETVEQFKKPNCKGGGCILAHCMGLGKTLQTIALIHTVMTSKYIGLKTALIMCPLNTVENWYNELKKWLKDVDKKLIIHKIYNEKNNATRAHALERWHQIGGVGIINYESFRCMVLNDRLQQNIKAKISAALLSPGPDIVVCDEGHVFKNAKSKMALAVNQIETKRRIVLTGTPLQNNLIEYHCMMEFVKPQLLGTKTEFSNRFVNPITNGQHKDSTPKDVSFMKKRAHVLHKLLVGCVQRQDYTVLRPYLPPKYEYVILINLSEIQKKMYTYYLESIKKGTTVKEIIRTGQLLKHAAHLAKVWSHPYAMEMKSANYNAESEDVIDVTDEKPDVFGCENESHIKSPDTIEAGPSKLSSQCVKDGGDWWSQFFKSKREMQLMEHSSKLVVLFEILKTCESISDKVLVFSQYLYSLDIIESHLKKLDELENTQDTFPSKVRRSRWRKNIEYFRIDGSTKSADRQKNCDSFNDTDTSRAKLFLISTKAGGLGINLIGANRVVIFDASWNPAQDMQSIFRAFRFGQTKPCYIYRLLANGTMEEKIYNRQVVKLSLSGRVVDEHQIERHFTFEDIAGMYTYDPGEKSDRNLPPVPKDRLLADLLISQKNNIDTYLEHDSLLQNQIDQGLTDEERKIAWDEYQHESLVKQRPLKGPNQILAALQANVEASQIMENEFPNFYPMEVEDRFALPDDPIFNRAAQSLLNSVLGNINF